MAEASIVSGTIVNDRVDDFTGHRITALFRAALPGGSGDDEANGDEAVEVRRAADADAEGSFRFELPPENEWLGPLELLVTGPSGLVLGSLTGLGTDDDLQDLRIEVTEDVPPVVIEAADDPALGTLPRFTGRVIDPEGRPQRAGLLVVLWGVPPGGGDAYPLTVTETIAGGYIAGEWPSDLLAGAHAVVDGREPVPIMLDGSRLPKRIILVVEDVPEAEEETPTPPRAPSAEDLALDPQAFSADAGGCTDFSVPNRTVEEVTFQAVVRTTQPAIKGATPPPQPQPLPPWIFDRIGQLAKMRPTFERLELSAQVDGSPAGSPAGTRGAETGDSSPFGVGDARSTPFDGTRTDVGGRPVGRDGASEAVERVLRIAEALGSGADPARGEERVARMMELRDLRAEPLRLEPSVLAELAQEPGEISPARLLDAEITSLVRRCGTEVDLLQGTPVDRFELDAAHQVDWDSVPFAYQASTIAHGHILTFKQVWRADGYSLGDLLYSLPLAPGQQKLMSILDWDRRETAVREERRRVTEQLDASLAHDRDISDIVRTSLHERLDASSRADTEAVGGAIGGFIGAVVFGAAGGVSSAGSSAGQTSARDVTASVLNRARDSTMQSASAVRGQRATVVQTARQGESVRAQTEAISNNNHCHALTIEYFEVLRHFQVSQELAHVQECLFVPFAISAFTERKAFNWRDSLRRGLRKPSLGDAFGSLERVVNNWEDADFPDGRYADETLRHLDGELWLQMSLPRPADNADNTFNQTAWDPYADLLGQPARDVWERYLGVALPEQRADIWNTRIAPGVAKRLIEHLKVELVDGSGTYRTVALDSTLVTPFRQNAMLLVTFRAIGGVPNLTRAQVNRVRISISGVAIPAAVEAIVQSGSMRYRTDHLSHFLFHEQAIQNDLGITDEVEILTPLDRIEKRNPKQRDRRLTDELVDHLNEHVEYYTRLMLLTMHPNRLYLLLDGVLAPDAGGRSVATVVENRVIGVVGNSLVMPVVPGMQLDPTYEFADETPEELVHLYAADPPPPMRISVPTRGVFAEAVMGRCNSCEVIDDTRFWRWEDEPIPDTPTGIAPLSTASRRREPPAAKPSDFPDALVRYQDVPEAPDPTGLAASLELLGTKDLFKNLTGLALNQENAAAALKSVMTSAQNFAAQGAALAQQKFLAGQVDRDLDLIKRARDKGDITPEQAQRLSESLFRGALGEKRTESPTATDSEAVRRSIERVSSSESGELRITRPAGTVEVKTGNRAITEGVDASIDPALVPLAQPSPMTCWAAAGAMLQSWRTRSSMDIQTVLDGLGGGWRSRFDADQGLTPVELRAFATALGLTEERPQSHTVEGIVRLLRSRGPLWVVTDDLFEGNHIAHVQIVTALKGDGSVDGTTVTLADSASGAFTTETFRDFARRLEAADPVSFGAGIYHY